jgi:uncharacterized coiled-coil protein SlyX
MLPRNKRRNTGELKLAPMEVKRPATAKPIRTNQVQQMEAAGTAAAPAEDGAPFGQAMQSLFALVGQMRNMNPDGAGASVQPRLILTGSGLELCLSGPESSGSPDRLAEIERSLKLLSARIGKLEEQVGTQSEAVGSLRAAVQQSEEMMETLVDSVSMMDDLSFGQPELVLGPETLAS